MKRVLFRSVYDAFDYVMDHFYPPGLEEMAERRDSYAVISIQDTHTQGFGFEFTESVSCRGVLTLYFEMKPDKNGDLHTDNGRLYATGAYVYKTEITMDSRLLCDLPPFDDATNSNKRKLRKKVTEDLLKSFGYKRPKSK
jgi:hypothetical protein